MKISKNFFTDIRKLVPRKHTNKFYCFANYIDSQYFILPIILIVNVLLYQKHPKVALIFQIVQHPLDLHQNML